MLQSMRSSISSWSVRILLTLIILSFVSFYGFQNDADLDQNIIARVNGHEITQRDLLFRFQMRLAAFRNFFQQDIPDNLIQGLQAETLNMLINEKLYARAAKRMGLVSSDQAVREAIKTQFSGESGEFDFEQYKKLVQTIVGKSTGAFEKSEAERLLAEDFSSLIMRTSWTSELDLKQRFTINNTKAVLAYIKLDADKLKSRLNMPVTEEALQAYYDKNKLKYEIPKKSRYEISWISLENLLSPENKELERHLKKLLSDKSKASGLRLHAAHILLKTMPENELSQKKKIESIRTEITNGKSFESAAYEYSEDNTRQQGGDLGYFGPGDMVPVFEKTAKSLSPGQISQPIKTSFGYHLITLYSKIEPGEPTLERLKPELVYLWKKDYFENPKKVERLVKQAETLFGSNETKPVTIQTGWISRDETIDAIPHTRDSQLIMSSTANLALGSMGNPLKSLGAKHVYKVKRIEDRPEEQPSLVSIKNKVKSDLEQELRKDALKSFAKKTLDAFSKENTPPKQAAVRLGLSAEKTEPFPKPENGKIPALGSHPTTLDKAFHSLSPGKWVDEPVQIGNDLYLIYLESRTTPNWEKFSKQKDELRTFAAEEDSRNRLDRWSTYLRSNAKIKQQQ